MSETTYTEEEHPMRRKCDDCNEHSGVMTAIESLTVTVDKIDESVKTLHNRLFNILVGVILCIMAAGFSTMATLYVSQNKRLDDLHPHGTTTPAIITERITYEN